MLDDENFTPIKITEVELSQPLQQISMQDELSGKVSQKAMILVRLHGYPLGMLTMDFLGGDITSVQLAVECWSIFSHEINQHLQDDGLMQARTLPAGGLRAETRPRCLTERDVLLSDASLISVVIATRDRPRSLALTLNSLLDLAYPQFEIFLVDNAPKTTATYDYYVANQARFMRQNISLRYIREETPGLAVAHNRGLEAVRSQFVAFTDDDVIVDRYWLAEILRGFTAANNVGCVTGLVIPLELQTPAQLLFEEFGGFTKGFQPRIYRLDGFRPAEPLFPYAAGKFGTGANMAFKTNALLDAGGFDPALGIGTPTFGADDMAAFYETILHNYQLVYQPSALVHHQHRRTYAELRRQMHGYGAGLAAFLTRCILKHPGAFLDMIPRIPAGFSYAFSADSAKNRLKADDYPRQLEWIERRGMLYGPFAYLYSCWRYRNQRVNRSQPGRMNEPSLAQHFVVNGWTRDK